MLLRNMCRVCGENVTRLFDLQEIDVNQKHTHISAKIGLSCLFMHKSMTILFVMKFLKNRS